MFGSRQSIFDDFGYQRNIASGRNRTEFKQSAVSGEALARELMAFANSQGGAILIGIDDDGTVSGYIFKREMRHGKQYCR